MRYSFLKRRAVYVPLALAALVSVAAAIVFNPAFQKKMLLDWATPQVDSIVIDSIHITPWSAEVSGLNLVYAGGEFQLATGRVRYGLLSLILKTIKVRSVLLKGAAVDLTDFAPPPPSEDEAPDEETGPFPGLLGSLDTGFSIVLDELSADAGVQLPAGRALTARISGGGIRPKTSGALQLDIRFETGVPDEHIDLNGNLRFEQLSGGRFSAVEAALAIEAALTSLPRPERLELRLLAQSAPEARPTPAENAESFRIPETLELSAHQDDDAGQQRSALNIEGLYDGNVGSFGGSYELSANERLIQRYAAERAVAPLRESLGGDIKFNLADLTGALTVSSDLLVTEVRPTYASDSLPEQLQLLNDFRLVLLPGRRLRVETLETTLSPGTKERTLTSSLTDQLDIPLDDFDAFLRQDQELLSFAIPDLPLAWLNVLLPEHRITGGSLNGAFVVSTDTAGALHVTPQRPLRVSDLVVEKAGKTVIEALTMAVSPAVHYTGDAVSIVLDAFELRAEQGVLLSADTTATVPLGGARSSELEASSSARLNLHALTDFLGAASEDRKTMPEILAMDFQAGVRQRPDARLIDRLDGTVSTSSGERLIRLALLEPLVLAESGEGLRVSNSTGRLATFEISDIDLSWFSAFVPGGALKGAVSRAEFSLAVESDGVLTFAPDRPFRLDGVTLETSDGPVLKALGVNLSPTVRFEPEAIAISYDNLELVSDDSRLLAGSGTVRLPGAADAAVRAEGRMDVDLQGLAQQPALQRLLRAGLNERVRLSADYRLSQSGDYLDIDRLTSELSYADGRPRLTLTADSGVRVLTRLADDLDPVSQARGEVVLGVDDLAAAPFKDLLAAYGLSFATANGQIVLSSDGRSMNITTAKPVEITGVSVRSEEGALLEPFALRLETVVDTDGKTLTARLNRYSLTFARDRQQPALTGTAALALDGSGKTLRLSALDAQLAVALAPLLRQPALLPDTSLTAGELNAVLSLDPTGLVDSEITLDGLAAGAALALQSVKASITGTFEADGRIALDAPVQTNGKSGVGDLEFKIRRDDQQAEDQSLSIAARGSVVYLNDLLNTLQSISGKRSAAAARKGDRPAETAAATGATDRDPRSADETPFWNPVGKGLRVSVDIERLFYTDYLKLTGITTAADLLPNELELDHFRAQFQNSPITANGALTFTPGPSPYDLKLKGGVDRLDLAKFFRELDPDSKPPAEGLFDLAIDAYGTAPNMPQFRNELFFDVRAQSRDGIFRLLDPNSAIVASATGLTGALGEVVSYLPTGLFGLGAVPRLVNYIKDIDYDTVDIVLTRDQSRNVRVRRYVVQSPEVLMTARGGIEYREGVDILDSPLQLEASLNVRGTGAAIMYDMGLLESEQDRWHYWKGPSIRFDGTLAAMESNLPDIIAEAGQGMLVGGVSRPISGLIGNIRHRWSQGKEPLEYDAEIDVAPAAGADGAISTEATATEADAPAAPPDEG